MKRFVVFLALILAAAGMAFAQNINVIYSFHSFHSPNGNYVEVYTSIDANSVGFNTLFNGESQQQLELITKVYEVNNPDSIVYFDKRIINGKAITDAIDYKNTSILDLQRFNVDNGKYIASFDLKDLSSTAQPLQYWDGFVVDYPDNQVNLSDIVLFDKFVKTTTKNNFSKCGYDLYPYMFDIIAKDSNVLHYYIEAYNTDQTFGEDEYFALVAVIENISTGQRVDSVKTIKRLKCNEITPYIGAIDISSLAEESYYLTLEIRNSDNILYAYKRYPFYKQSDKKMEINNMDLPKDAFVHFLADSLLDDYVNYTLPIASPAQQRFIFRDLPTATASQKKYYLYQAMKGLNEYNPNRAWYEYLQKINYVNNNYKTQIKPGYQTDMGRIYLTYGAPDYVIDEKFTASSGLQQRSQADKQLNPYAPDVDADGVNYYPYQIWIYNSTPFGEANRKFIFYAKQSNLVEYFLLHSNAKGEVYDMYWERTLSRNTLEDGVEGKAGKQFRVGHE